MFGAVHSMVLTSIDAVHSRLKACAGGGHEPVLLVRRAGKRRAARGCVLSHLLAKNWLLSVPDALPTSISRKLLLPAPALLQVRLSLIPPEVVLAPSTGEVTKQLLRTMRNLAESAKAFRRWMDGTCLECPEQ